MRAVPLMALIPNQEPKTCKFGHRLSSRNTALDMTGTLICLTCVALVNEAQSNVTGRLLAVLLDLSPMPSREEVYGS